MSLPHALLTELVERPRSGSELAARFDKSIGFFWHASHQQIYRELARLEEAGYIESLPEEPTRGRKRAYRLLPAGMQRLREWMTEPTSPMPLRDELMLRLWSEASVGPSGLEDEVRRRLAAHQTKLALYRSFETRDYPYGPQSREAALQHLVLQAGIRYERNWVEMLEEALAILAHPVACAPAQPDGGCEAPPDCAGPQDAVPPPPGAKPPARTARVRRPRSG